MDSFKKPTYRSCRSVPLLLVAVTVTLSTLIAGCDGVTDPGVDNEWLISRAEILDGGPGKDGIPSIDNPRFAPASEVTFVPDSRLVVGVAIDSDVRAYPHQILDWHEIVNDEAGGVSFAVTHCPLTGTAMTWNRNIGGGVTQFGVSGLIYRNNLILYDRTTDSNWSQMMLMGVRGEHAGRDAELLPTIETTWATWKTLFPESSVLTTQTGFNRPYQSFAYGADYLTDHNRIVFPVRNRDNRMPAKERVHGIIVSNGSASDVRVFRIADFGEGISARQVRIGNDEFVAIGSTEFNFAIAFHRQLSDGTMLSFSAVNDDLPLVVQDEEGNRWDVFGRAVSGPRQGERLRSARSYTGYWFAWADMFPSVTIIQP